MKLKNMFKYFSFIFLMIVLSVSNVYATDSDVHFCEYPGTLRALKIFGIILLILKIVVPILIMFVTVVDFVKPILSGKSEDLTKNISTFAKRLVAAFLIYFLPGIFDYIFNDLITYDNPSLQACTICLLDTNNCVIPDSEPVIYDSD